MGASGRAHTGGEVVALDGKTLRRSHDRRAGRPALHLVSTWAETNRVVLGQVAVRDASIEIAALPHGHLRTVDGEHGRLETREYWTVTDPELLAYLDPNGAWAGLSSVGMIGRERCLDGEATRELRYYLSSLDRDALTFARAVRGRRGIESRVH